MHIDRIMVEKNGTIKFDPDFMLKTCRCGNDAEHTNTFFVKESNCIVTHYLCKECYQTCVKNSCILSQ